MLDKREIDVAFNEKDSSLSVCFHSPDIKISGITTSINVNGKLFKINLLKKSESQIENRKNAEIIFSGYSDDLSLDITVHFIYYSDRNLIGLFGRLENNGTETASIYDFVLMRDAHINFGCENDEIKAHIAHGIAHPTVVPLVVKDENGKKDFHASSNGMATLASKNGSVCIGFLTGKTNRPIISVNYLHESDEVRVDGIARFNGIKLPPKDCVETDLLILQVDKNPFTLLESYASLIAEIDPPRKTNPTIGWCSWYAIRMPISHEFTMANARVVADRFRDLGMDIMLLDHGWQTGDICGDWDEDEKDYPKGLEGLAKDLNDLGLKLGIWIAPTEVSGTSKIFNEHPNWVLKDQNGNPQETWKWYWVPNPPQYQMDATNPDAYKYIVDTFRRLTKKGSVYYKIDFIAGCAGENLYPEDPKAVRGWTPLQKAMQAVREGAGEDAYVRYCQTPPLLSIGLADGVFATSDTLDAGATTWNVLKEVFRMSSAQYYLHELYVHDACDLSIRAHAGTEECRLRVMMLALSGSSIMFSDDLTKLPEERIIMMQQSIPPFPKPACPINLFTSEMPDIWHIKCSSAGIEWDLLALFNFDENQRQINLSLKELGLLDGEYIIREFWTEQFVGISSESASFLVPGLSGRLFSFWRSQDRPQYVGTNLHLSQGQAELIDISWDENAKKLSGTFSRAKGIKGKAYFNIPQRCQIKRSSNPIQRQNGGLWAMDLMFNEAKLSWEIEFN